MKTDEGVGKRGKKGTSVASIARWDGLQNGPRVIVQWGHCQMLPGECAKEEETKQLGLSFGTVLASPSKVCPTFVLPSIHLPANQSFFTSLLLNSSSPFLCASSSLL